jgi:hypothetical protein
MCTIFIMKHFYVMPVSSSRKGRRRKRVVDTRKVAGIEVTKRGTHMDMYAEKLQHPH